MARHVQFATFILSSKIQQQLFSLLFAAQFLVEIGEIATQFCKCIEVVDVFSHLFRLVKHFEGKHDCEDKHD